MDNLKFLDVNGSRVVDMLISNSDINTIAVCSPVPEIIYLKSVGHPMWSASMLKIFSQ
jgi:hypothetical protein